MESKNYNLTYASIFRIVVVLAMLGVLYLIREVVAVLFISIVFASAIDPFVDWMKKHKIPRAVSVLVVYLIILGIVSLVIVLMIPPLAQEMSQLAKNLPYLFERFGDFVARFKQTAIDNSGGANLSNTLQTLAATMTEATKSVFSTISGIFGGLISLIVVLVITFYITVEEDALKKFIRYVIPKQHESYIMGLMNRIQLKMGMWLRGQIFLSLIVGALVYFGLVILGVKYALVLALVAAVLEIIPFIGPTIAAIPAILVAFTGGWAKALVVLILYVVVQQLENNIIVPKIMQKTVGLNPIVVIIVIMVGAKLGGIVGALIAVPVAAAIGVFVGDVMRDRAEIKE